MYEEDACGASKQTCDALDRLLLSRPMLGANKDQLDKLHYLAQSQGGLPQFKAVYTVHNIVEDSFAWAPDGEVWLTVIDGSGSVVPGEVVGIAHKHGAEPCEGDAIISYQVIEVERAILRGLTRLRVRPLGGEQGQARVDHKAELQKLITAFDLHESRMLPTASFSAAVERARAAAS